MERSNMVPLIGRGMPALGMRCDPDPMQLPDGIGKLFSNFRCRNSTLAIREGCTQIGANAPVANASLRGYWSGYIGGSYRMVAAFRVGAVTNLYSYSLSGNTWTAITGASFATDGQVQFAPAKTRSSTTPAVAALNTVIAQNGLDSPIAWNVAGTTAAAVTAATSFTGTQAPYAQNSIEMVSCALANGTAAEWILDAVGAAARLRALVRAAAPARESTITGTVWFNQLSGIGPVNMTLNGQLVLVVLDIPGSPASPYDRLTRLDVFDDVSATWKTIWDNVSVGNVVVRDLPVPSATFSRSRLFAYSSGLLEGITITAIRVWNDTTACAAIETAYIGFVGTTGLNLSSTQYAFSRFVSNTGMESAATPAVVNDGVYFVANGGDASVMGATRWPSDANIFTSYYLTQSGTLGATPPNYLYTYASVGGSEYGLVSVDGASTFGQTYRTNDEPNYIFNPHDETSVTMPTGAAIAAVNGRILIGSGPDLWQSGLNDPMHFASAATVDADGNVDETSPDYRNYPGEYITAFCPLPGVVYGVGSVVIFTLGNTYRLAIGKTSQFGSYTSIVGHRGCRHPYSIQVMDGMVWFLDSENHVRYTNGGSSGDSPSLGKVNTRIAAGSLYLSSVDRVCGLASFDYYGLYYPGSDPATGTADTSPREGLIFDQLTGEWVLDRFPFDIAGVTTIDDGTVRRILGITTAGLVYQLYSSSTTDAGTAITARYEGPELTAGGWTNSAFGDMAVLADTIASTSWTTQRYNPKTGTSENGTVVMSDGTLMIYSYDQSSTGGFVGVETVSCVPILFGTGASGVRVRQLGIEIGPRSQGAIRA